MKAIDKAAMQLAIDQTLAEPDVGRVAQVESMIDERNFAEVGAFCAYHRQTRSLSLKPWESPPCWSNGEGDSPDAVCCVRCLRRACRDHPDPIAPLAEAEAAL